MESLPKWIQYHNQSYLQNLDGKQEGFLPQLSHPQLLVAPHPCTWKNREGKFINKKTIQSKTQTSNNRFMMYYYGGNGSLQCLNITQYRHAFLFT